MRSAFYVQQRDGRDWTWRTMAGPSTHAAATGFAEELGKALDALPYRRPLPVRVVSAGELAADVRNVARGRDAATPTASVSVKRP
jgi:hypothetical protein